MEKFVDLLKIIAEKYLFQAIASAALAILAVAFFPNLFGITDKIGATWYGILIFCLTFLLLRCAKFVFILAKKKTAEKKEKKLSDELEKRKAEERDAKTIEQLWDYVDSLTPQDKHYLIKFLKTGNQPIAIRGAAFDIGLLTNRDFVACTEKQQQCTPTLNQKNESDEYMAFSIPNINMIYSSPITLYQLKDDFFELLKYSYEKYGKISHFDMEEESEKNESSCGTAKNLF